MAGVETPSDMRSHLSHIACMGLGFALGALIAPGFGVGRLTRENELKMNIVILWFTFRGSLAALDINIKE